MLINRQFGDYILLRRLAVGGQSEVFLAIKNGPNGYTRPIVIKALPSGRRDDPRHLELFYREAFISSRFFHPHVINVHDAKVIDGESCMMMDFVSGQTVADIAQRGFQQGIPPTIKQVVQMLADASDGLHYVHNFRDLDNQQYSVVHRDVSPQNLMVTYRGLTMVFDFGIARVIGLDSDDEKLAGGKYAYMSPEQVNGDPVDPRADIFSLGIILYELCTGFRLFRRDSPPEVLNAVLDEPIQSPRELRPEIPQFLENIIMRALDRDPFKRYQVAADMRDDLKRFLEMTSDGSDIRRGLGAYVQALFKEERKMVAGTLQQAPEIVKDSRPIESDESIEDLGSEEFGLAESTLELPIHDVAARVHEMRQNSINTGQESSGEVAGLESAQLRKRLDDMHRRQTMLLAVLALVGLLAVILALARFIGEAP